MLIFAGDLHYRQHRQAETQKAYEAALQLTGIVFLVIIVYLHGTEVTDAAVHVRLGNMHWDAQRYADAKLAYMTACKYKPSATTWVGVGKASLALGEYEDAEDAFSVPSTPLYFCTHRAYRKRIF